MDLKQKFYMELWVGREKTLERTGKCPRQEKDSHNVEMICPCITEAIVRRCTNY
jgi:hypothetical protein